MDFRVVVDAANVPDCEWHASVIVKMGGHARDVERRGDRVRGALGEHHRPAVHGSLEEGPYSASLRR